MALQDNRSLAALSRCLSAHLGAYRAVPGPAPRRATGSGGDGEPEDHARARATQGPRGRGAPESLALDRRIASRICAVVIRRASRVRRSHRIYVFGLPSPRIPR